MQHMSHDWLKKYHPDNHISMLICGNKIHSGVTFDWSRNTNKDIMIIGTEMYFPSYHMANSTSYSTSIEVLVPSRIKNKHEHLKIQKVYTGTDARITRSAVMQLQVELSGAQWRLPDYTTKLFSLKMSRWFCPALYLTVISISVLNRVQTDKDKISPGTCTTNAFVMNYIN